MPGRIVAQDNLIYGLKYRAEAIPARAWPPVYPREDALFCDFPSWDRPDGRPFFDGYSSTHSAAQGVIGLDEHGVESMGERAQRHPPAVARHSCCRQWRGLGERSAR